MDIGLIDLFYRKTAADIQRKAGHETILFSYKHKPNTNMDVQVTIILVIRNTKRLKKQSTRFYKQRLILFCNYSE